VEVRKPGAKVKLLLIGSFCGFVIGVVLIVFYFSMATFFAVQARVLQKAAEKNNENAEDASTIDRRKLRELTKENLALAERSPSQEQKGFGKATTQRQSAGRR
jgi:hypothetical protein